MEPAAHFDHAASRYHKQVYQRKRADLLKTIHTTLHPLFYNQLKNLSKLTVIRFKKALGAGLKGEGCARIRILLPDIDNVNFCFGTAMTSPKSSTTRERLVSNPSSGVRGRHY
jgi:hypothetical protein